MAQEQEGVEVNRQELERQARSKNPRAGEPQRFPKQGQEMPGEQSRMQPEPIEEDPEYRASGKLEGKVALITGGDSGIGRSVAIAYAKEGADIAIVYLNEDEDAQKTRERVEDVGRRCLTIAGDVGSESFCRSAVDQAVEEFGHLDILVNNAAEQHPVNSIEELSAEQLERTFRTNIFGYFFMAKAALKHLKPGAAIINTASINSFKPSPSLIDYAATKGAIDNFTKALSEEVLERGIRVNAVAPGPVWTPLIVGSFSEERVQKFGSDYPMQRAAQPYELAPAYVFLASERDSSYISGETILVAGGKIAG